MKKKILTLLFFLCGLTIYAQGIENTAETIISPHYFIAVLAGVLLAMGFQFILTALSVAAGITAIGDVREKYVHSKNHVNNKDHFDDEEPDNDSSSSVGTMVTTGFGIWSIITVGLSLFGATALALELVLVTSTTVTITLGLVIWATFFILLFYLESKMVNSLVGGLINTATAGLRASGEAVKEMFSASKDMLSTSREKQMKHVAESTVDKIRKDFDDVYDPAHFNEAIDKFFKGLNNTIDKQVPDYDQIKKDLTGIVHESAKADAKEQKKQGLEPKSSSGTKWMAIQQVLNSAISESSKASGDQSKTEQLKALSKEAKEAYERGFTTEDKIKNVVVSLTPAEEEQVQKYMDKIKQFLSEATPGDMEPEQLQKQLWHLLDNPGEAKSKVMHKVSQMDKNTLVSVLSKNTSLQRNEAEKYADKIAGMLQKLKSKDHDEPQVHGTPASHYESSPDLVHQVKEMITNFTGSSSGSSSMSDMDFSMLKNYFMGTMDNSKHSLGSIKRKLSNTDKESVIAMVKKNGMVKPSQVDKVVQSFEDAKTSVLDKVQKIEDTARRSIENTKRKAVIEAENTRKNAAAAAWWLVGSAIISAGAAIAGSLLSIA